MKIFTLRHSWPVILEAKRRESILLAMALVFAVFTACDNGSSSTDPDPIAEVSSSSDEVSKNSSSSQKSSGKEKSSSSVEKSKSSSSEGKVASSSSKKDENSSSSVKKEDSSSSVVIASSSSSIKVDGSSASVKPESSSTETSSAAVASSSSMVEESSSSSYDRTDAFKGTLWRKGEYKTFVDSRDNREYYYIQITGEDTAGKAASIKVMAENLNVGEKVYGFENQEDDAKIERYCYDDDTTNCNKYGGLYQWAEMMQLPSRCNTENCADLIKPNHQGICPSGWRLLTYNDYYIVVHADNNEDGVKGTRSAYGFGGSNDSGYSLISTGYLWDHSFTNVENGTYWHYPVESDQYNGIASKVSSQWRTATGNSYDDSYKTQGFSVRCVMVE
ncbi:MAG: FISUMP domain-containing protein [Fibrobacter sp.]|uniref:FISUMP domain-containing protein n=1 Tax=Fibrobacter sp. TaxID=35828 RepID=UPI002A9094A7|nr:FISUMP domain-containing protein [Fibrobacter sp.]MDY6263771.1 FISUMP domain-containing protein [Fibrobacter sp.]